jgi:hypothetical protein
MQEHALTSGVRRAAYEGNGEAGTAESPTSKTGEAPAASMPPSPSARIEPRDLERIAQEVYDLIEERLAIERESQGL